MAETTTPRWQRIVIWIIAITMIVGTMAGLIFMVLAIQNKEIDPNTIAQEEYMKQYEAMQKEYEEQLAEMRESYRGLDGYTDYVTSFDAASVTELSVETLKEGDGATISADDSIKVNYTGWTPNGKIFDSTKSEGEDASPATLSMSNLIDGWSEGLAGKKVGGVYLMSIPADKAYGESGSDAIEPNEPIKFIVEVISIEQAD
ncbi:MAG: FKBP-type peptidyl-prolyl cis-trans isomerase [Candidatus Saccharibacteria bacterium]|nr:FKBP-type peptidyl-prolyl cis-trans isomerase [Candidatus Saccharibacteria bacterium]